MASSRTRSTGTSVRNQTKQSTITEYDIVAEMMASRPSPREPGWYTRNELAAALGESPNTIQNRVNRGVKSGAYECKSARVADAAGRIVNVNVYRLKPSK